MNNEEKIMVVSESFVKIYKHFNVTSQVEDMQNLTRKELLLMLTLAIDSFSEENPIVIENFRNFKNELNLIFDLQQDKEVDDSDILSLAQETGEKYINTSAIRIIDGETLPDPLSDEEAMHLRREIGIDKIIN